MINSAYRTHLWSDFPDISHGCGLIPARYWGFRRLWFDLSTLCVFKARGTPILPCLTGSQCEPLGEVLTEGCVQREDIPL
jgi:hypothetical protein